MGPAATADLYAKIIAATPARRDQDHLHVVIWADPSVPDRSTAILGRGPDPTAALIAGARALERSGADLLAVACNTAHAMLPAVAGAIGVPVVDMIDETVEAIRSSPAIRSVAVLGTAGMLRAQLYQPRLRRAQVQVVEPDADQQAVVSSVIARVKAGAVDPGAAAAELAAVVAALPPVDAVVAACTELPLVVPEGPWLVSTGRRVQVVDTAAVLARAVVRRAGEMSLGAVPDDEQAIAVEAEGEIR
jgi:aspartate racemase